MHNTAIHVLLLSDALVFLQPARDESSFVLSCPGRTVALQPKCAGVFLFVFVLLGRIC